MTDDLVFDLISLAKTHDPDSHAADILDSAAAEILRLTSLINTWVDADDNHNELWQRGRKRTAQEILDAELAIDTALTALRKAVRR